HNVGHLLVHLDDFPRAYGAIRQSIALCDEGGFERLASHNRMFLAFLDGVAGDAAGADLLRQGIRYAEAHDYTWDALSGRYLLRECATPCVPPDGVFGAPFLLGRGALPPP